MAALDLSLVIPCYRDASHLRANAAEVVRILQDTRLAWEIIFVNDASPEHDREVAAQVIADWPGERISLINHEKNTGRGRAVTDGLRAAQGRFGGFLDIDLEVPAHYIPPMVRRLQAGADVVCAHRIYKTHLGLLHRAILSSGYVALVRRVLGVDLLDTEAGYKFFRMDRIGPVLDACVDPHWFWDTEIMVRAHLAGLKVEFVHALFLRNADKASTVRIFSDTIAQFRRLIEFREEVAKLRAKQPGTAASPAGVVQ